MGSETLPSACYILSDESSIPFYSTSNGYKNPIRSIRALKLKKSANSENQTEDQRTLNMSNSPALLQLSEIHLNQLLYRWKSIRIKPLYCQSKVFTPTTPHLRCSSNPHHLWSHWEDNRRFRSSSHRGVEIQRMGKNKNVLNQSFWGPQAIGRIHTTTVSSSTN